MADSAKDSKVEDVLSSVRRLVSEEVPRKERPQMPPGPGALVLTDADRVQKDSRSEGRARSLEQRIAELEAAVDRRNEEFEPDGSEDQSLNVPDRIVYTRPPSAEEQDEMRGTLRLSEIALIKTAPTDEVDAPESDEDVENIAAVPFRTVSKQRVKSRIPTDLVAEAPMAEDVPTEPAKKATVSAFTNPDDVIERIDEKARRVSRPSPQYEAMPLTQPKKKAGRDNVSEPPKDDFDAALMAAVKASVVETVRSELTDALPERDALVEDAKPEPQETQEQQAEVALQASPAEQAVLADNAALRQLVAELIREELQGELGERITRNVRKLVRREIKRALASEDLI